MNSVEKKAPEPSMDDIISSIRNIIADDTQVSPTAAPEPAEEKTAPSVVKLTENQIAEPVGEVELAADMSEPADDPKPAEADAFDAFDDLQVANEIDAVPGAEATPESATPLAAETPSVEAVQTPEASEMVEPEAATTEFAAIAPVDEAPAPAKPEIIESVAAVPEDVSDAPILSQETKPEAVAPAIVPETASAEPEKAPVADAPVAEVDTAPADVAASDIAAAEDFLVDVGFGSPEKSEPSSPSPVTENPMMEILKEVESVLQQGDASGSTINADQKNESAVDNKPAEIQPAALVADIAPVVAAPPPPPAVSVAAIEPVILDASRVTPEDAAAITAVAAATSEALAGTPNKPVKKPGSITLEDSIKAMLKPMIREWLDDNMPRILEGAIQEEVDDS
jgi:cell pole-organizing protein PopZ